MAMEYGQQAFSVMKAAENARAAEAAMNEAGENVASQGDAPDTLAAIQEQEKDMAARYEAGPAQFESAPEASDEDEGDEPAMLKGAALKARAEELGIPSGMSADETRAAIADAEGMSGSELHGDVAGHAHQPTSAHQPES